MLQMPVVFRYKGYRFFFFSNEGEPLEPLHVHVRKGEYVAKFWINPVVTLEDAYGFRASELREIADVVEENRELIERCWHEHFGD